MAPCSARVAARAAPGGHRCAVPEVTFGAGPVATAARAAQHGRMPMPPPLRTLLQPLNLPAVLSWLGVGLSLPYDRATQGPLVWTVMAVFLFAFLGDELVGTARARRGFWFSLQATTALAICYLAPRGGAAPALLVILVAQLAMSYPLRRVVAMTAALNLALYLILSTAGNRGALIITLCFIGFQGFAVLVAHYARGAEQARDRLALVNADLLATRALLADSARDAERLRMARELHDVAGHKLTAMMLNLRALAAEPDLAERREVQVAQQLAGELLGDIRSVVQALRDARGLDLATALRALAAPLPRPALELDLDDELNLTDPALAETLLRVVQEALTNAARHADAARLRVALHRDGAALELRIADDGRVHAPLREGNGLSGMRERVAAAGGELDFSLSPEGAMRIHARFPLQRPLPGPRAPTAATPA
ncbi:histidine kinase [Lysobacter yananisis]|uniref:Histidine kinase n=1 Tax=Lysobacter yananisis TaxID=1003114 RepID=A0ABY9PEJ4_9GAMM|nr:histidine kinase [Lysobacter yananisis]WMT04616.1 histidine kinase [Lysobacter yananisis]